MDHSPESPNHSPPGLEELREPTPDFIDQVLAIVVKIPPGRVMAYGDVATAIGPHPDLAGTTGSYGARLVGNVMSRFGENVPWWRVIRSTGHPPRFHEEKALPYYRAEGTPLTGPDDAYRIDMKRARYDPGDPTPTQATLL
jgi:alkylated DNA nucleotide flippase Atl1